MICQPGSAPCATPSPGATTCSPHGTNALSAPRDLLRCLHPGGRGGGGGSRGGLPVFDGIAALIEQSLVRQAPGANDEPRYVMLEIVREFGLEMLIAAGELENSRERHARYFLGPADSESTFTSSFAPVFKAPERSTVLAERDNVRLALASLDEWGELETLLSPADVALSAVVGSGTLPRRSGVDGTRARAFEHGCAARPLSGARRSASAGTAPRRSRSYRSIRRRQSGARARTGRPGSDWRSPDQCGTSGISARRVRARGSAVARGPRPAL